MGQALPVRSQDTFFFTSDFQLPSQRSFSTPSVFSAQCPVRRSPTTQVLPAQAGMFGGLIYWGGSALFGLGGTAFLLGILQWARHQVEQEGNIDGLETLFHYADHENLLVQNFVETLLSSLNLERLRAHYEAGPELALPIYDLLQLYETYHHPEALNVLVDLVAYDRAQVESGHVAYYERLEDARKYPDSVIQALLRQSLSALNPGELIPLAAHDQEAFHILLTLAFERENPLAMRALQQVDLVAVADFVHRAPHPTVLVRSFEAIVWAGVAGNPHWNQALDVFSLAEDPAFTSTDASSSAASALLRLFAMAQNNAELRERLRELNLESCERLVAELRQDPRRFWQTLSLLDAMRNVSGVSVLAGTDPLLYAHVEEGERNLYSALLLEEMVRAERYDALEIIARRVEEGARLEDLRALRRVLENRNLRTVPRFVMSFDLTRVQAAMGENAQYDCEAEACFDRLASFNHEAAEAWRNTQTPEDRMLRRYFQMRQRQEGVMAHLEALRDDPGHSIETTREYYALQILMDWDSLSESDHHVFYGANPARALGEVPRTFVVHYSQRSHPISPLLARSLLMAWVAPIYDPYFDAFAIPPESREVLLRNRLFRTERGELRFDLCHPQEITLEVQRQGFRLLAEGLSGGIPGEHRFRRVETSRSSTRPPREPSPFEVLGEILERRGPERTTHFPPALDVDLRRAGR